LNTHSPCAPSVRRWNRWKSKISIWRSTAKRSWSAAVFRARYRTNPQHIWGALPGDESLTLAMTFSGRLNTKDLDLLYTARDVSRLDEEGKARRSGGKTEVYLPGISQCLRSIASYVNGKQARLLSIARKADAITVAFETGAGEFVRETLSVVEVYDLSISLLRKRTPQLP
jgi:hypothetical protein